MGPLQGLCTIVKPETALQDFADQHAREVNPDNELALWGGALGEPQVKSGVFNTSRRWPNGMILRVHFLDGDQAVHQRVEPIAHEWSQFANIQFQFGAGPDAEIRVAFNPKVGSWSYMGTDCSLPQLAGKPTMNLGWLTAETPEIEYRRVVLHEFGHALGLLHEHLSPTADIPWDEAKVISYYQRTNGWKEEYIRSNVLAIPASDRYTEFDKHSIMLYPVPRELTKNGYEIPWSNSELSATDRKFIAEIYPFPT